MKKVLMFMFPLILTQFVYASEVKPEILRAIADDLDAVVGDTVDEGSWNADIIRDESGQPLKSTCIERPTRKGPLYICSFTFKVSPYDGEDLGTDPWESVCENLLYFVEPTMNSKFKVTNYKETEQACLETLNETPF